VRPTHRFFIHKLMMIIVRMSKRRVRPTHRFFIHKLMMIIVRMSKRRVRPTHRFFIHKLMMIIVRMRVVRRTHPTLTKYPIAFLSYLPTFL